MTSRAIAIRCLVEQNKNNLPVDQVLASLLERHPLSDTRDRQLAMALVYGVLRHRQELDALLKPFSRTPLQKLKPLVLQALRIGIYQLLFMDRIPASAAVNETVKALGRQPKWLKGFVNGVLRSVVRDIDGARQRLASLPDEVRLNHPEWLMKMWQEQFGLEQMKELCAANNTPPPLSIRLNPRFTNQDAYLDLLAGQGITARPGQFTDYSVLIDDFQGPIASLPGYGEGLFHVQDEAAQLIASFFTDLPAGSYLDGCAGLGGKTILLDQVLTKDCQIAAVEPHKGRRQLLEENIERCRCRPITIYSARLQELAQDRPALFDGILLDAPCSGLGVIRRQPDIRWNRSYDDLVEMAHTQLEILSAAAELLKPGGILVYVTCSLSLIENEQVIDSFLTSHPNFSISPPVFSDQVRQKLLTPQGFLRTLPPQGLDGFFAARLTLNKK